MTDNGILVEKLVNGSLKIIGDDNGHAISEKFSTDYLNSDDWIGNFRGMNI